jgi:chemotaxis protein MotB
MNNWLLSSARAEATRKALADAGVSGERFAKIEGVADRDPYYAQDIYDPRNRRMSIILGWTGGKGERASAEAANAEGEQQSDEVKAAIKLRDDPVRKLNAEVTALDMGGTGLPAGAVPINRIPGKKAEGVPKPGKH